MILHKVVLIAEVAEKNSDKPLSPTFNKTYHVWDDCDFSDQEQQFMYRVKSIFLSECERGLIEGVDLKKLDNYYIDACILGITSFRSEELQDYYKLNPDIITYSNN